MNALVNAWSSEGVTTNGMKTNTTSMSACMDLFFLAGASRGKDISVLFLKALSENPDIALRTLLWMRDVRGGAGERQQFRNLLRELSKSNSKYAELIVPKIPEIGRWDDIFELLGTDNEDSVIKLLKKAYDEGNGLAGKWSPRYKSFSNELNKAEDDDVRDKILARKKKHNDLVYKIINALGMTPKQYRKTIVALTKVVETQMCKNQWSDINYEHVPSVAASRYQKCFDKHDSARYQAYRNAVSKGKAKVNASAIFPHDIVKACRGGGKIADEQWKALPDFMSASEERILPVCDVSGSMTGLPMDVSVSLGLYISERNKGIFKDVVCTFSESPNLITLKTKKLSERIRELQGINWGMNTNIEAVFNKLLSVALQHSVSETDMPTMMLIISDMEFDQASRYNQSAIEMIRQKYELAGYNIPKIVFWNVNSRQGNVPVKINDKGVALVSGFSPAILTSLLSNPSEFTPEGVMLKTLMIDKYKVL